MSVDSKSLPRMLGARIAQLREVQGLTQERLAWEAGFRSKGYLSRIEAGLRLPSLDALDKIAQRLGVEVRDLLIFPERSRLDRAMEALRGSHLLVKQVLSGKR